MTFLEKLKENNPKFNYNEGDYPVFCPNEIGLEDTDECPGGRCLDCWNREMPNTEPHFSNPVIEKAYNTGLNDAWELVRKINNMEFKEFIKVFERTGYDGREVKMHLIDDLTPQEALAKLKAYEEAQSKIDIGDVVVDLNEKKGLVIGILPDEDKVDVWYEGDGRPQIMSTRFLTKTGEHINLGQIIKQIGE